MSYQRRFSFRPIFDRTSRILVTRSENYELILLIFLVGPRVYDGSIKITHHRLTTGFNPKDIALDDYPLNLNFLIRTEALVLRNHSKLHYTYIFFFN